LDAACGEFVCPGDLGERVWSEGCRLTRLVGENGTDFQSVETLDHAIARGTPDWRTAEMSFVAAGFIACLRLLPSSQRLSQGFKPSLKSGLRGKKAPT
jgi:hypothetical protein